MNKDFSNSFYANSRNIKKPSLNKSSQPYVPRSRPYSQASSIKGAGGSLTSNQSLNFDLMLNDGEVFPEDVLILLGEEERNIKSFRERIEKEKAKIQNDFLNFEREIEHITQDIKISMQAELDKVYRYFIEKYASLKSEVQEIKKIRKEIQTQTNDAHYQCNIPTTSNKELIKELTKDSKNYKIYRIQNYITELQKKRINPLLDLSKQIILLETSSQNYYNSEVSAIQLNALKQQIGHFTSHMFSNLGKYVTNPSQVFENNLVSEISVLSDKKEELPDFMPLREVQHKEFIPRDIPIHSREIPYSQQLGRQSRQYRGNSKEFRQRRDQRQSRDPRQYLDENVFTRPDVPPIITKSVYTSPEIERYKIKQFDANSYVGPNSQPFSLPQQQNFSQTQPASQPRRFNISQSQQILSTGWAEDIKLNYSKTIYPEHSTILCAMVINNTYIATGGKDSMINVYTLEGMRIATLKAHTASVCTLAVVNNLQGKTTMLVSGGDVGCGTLVFWDVNSWMVRSKIKAHDAAISSILDLGDGQTLVSGSYDKLINIYNHKRAEVLYNLSANKSSVIGIILSVDGSRMTSYNLQKSLYVWRINRRQGIVESIQLQRVIQNDVMICSMNASMLRSNLVITGTKDGRIKFWNLDSGQCQKTLTANNSAIIELVVVERQSKPNYPLVLSCSSKDRSLVLTNTQTLVNSLFEVNDKLNIEFGCGIGPKIVFDRHRGVPIIVLVSQSSQRKEVNIFEMQIR